MVVMSSGGWVPLRGAVHLSIPLPPLEALTHILCDQPPDRQAACLLSTTSTAQHRSHSSIPCLHLLRDRQPSHLSERPTVEPRRRWWRARRAGEHAGKRQEGVQGGTAGEAERRAAAALEEEALRPDRGRRAAAAAQAARPPAAPPAAPRRRRGRGQSQGAALRKYEDGGLRGAEGQVRVLHGGHDGGQGDRLQVPAGRGLERGDHIADGPVQESAGDPGGEVHPTEAAAARGADARPEDRPQLAERCVTCGESRGHWRAISG